MLETVPFHGKSFFDTGRGFVLQEFNQITPRHASEISGTERLCVKIREDLSHSLLKKILCFGKNSCSIQRLNVYMICH